MAKRRGRDERHYPADAPHRHSPPAVGARAEQDRPIDNEEKREGRHPQQAGGGDGRQRQRREQ
ncbi:MAG: hypothetical protein KKB63_13395, partial [Alphaproteobacteria bacterium]|nr:hypothetical protein [Alphaproteobacteria bacterium]